MLINLCFFVDNAKEKAKKTKKSTEKESRNSKYFFSFANK
jgi:hypothetical protein